jgi:hypothetical protein
MKLVLINPKLHMAAATFRAGNEAVGVWFRGLSLCASRSRALELSRADVQALTGGSRRAARRVTDRLITAGFWEHAPDGVRVVDLYIGTEKAFRFDFGESWSRVAYPETKARDLAACRYCGSEDQPTIDHVIPRSQGGGDEASNLVVACWDCNRKKGGRTPEQAGMMLRPPPTEEPPR